MQFSCIIQQLLKTESGQNGEILYRSGKECFPPGKEMKGAEGGEAGGEGVCCRQWSGDGFSGLKAAALLPSGGSVRVGAE